VSERWLVHALAGCARRWGRWGVDPIPARVQDQCAGSLRPIVARTEIDEDQNRTAPPHAAFPNTRSDLSFSDSRQGLGGPDASGRRLYGRRRTDGERHDGIRTILWVAAAVLLLDWSTKALVAWRVPVGRMVELVPDRVALWHIQNPAMILGLFGGLPLVWRQALAVLLGVTAAVLLVQVLTRAKRLLPHRRRWAWTFGGLVFGGMVGNLGERAVHWTVTDFLSFRWGSIWLPPGNIADLAIVSAIPLALAVIIFELEARSLRGTGTARDRRPAAAPLPADREAADLHG
jgi:lipoprotein signal peptidase